MIDDYRGSQWETDQARKQIYKVIRESDIRRRVECGLTLASIVGICIAVACVTVGETDSRTERAAVVSLLVSVWLVCAGSQEVPTRFLNWLLFERLDEPTLSDMHLLMARRDVRKALTELETEKEKDKEKS